MNKPGDTRKTWNAADEWVEQVAVATGFAVKVWRVCNEYNSDVVANGLPRAAAAQMAGLLLQSAAYCKVELVEEVEWVPAPTPHQAGQ